MDSTRSSAGGSLTLPHCIQIGEQVINAGEQRSFEVPIVELPTGTWLTMPMHVVCGSAEGPSLWLTATIHGEELNGLEIIHRVLSYIQPQDFAGALIAAPVMNVLGFFNQKRTLPDGSDLNRSFPGSPDGSIAERIAHFFLSQIAAQCSYGIDLHSGANNRINPPQIRANLDDMETRRLAEAFAAPITMNAADAKGTLRSAAIDAGNRVLLFEGGEPLRYNEDSLSAGTSGVLRVLEELDMLKQAPVQPAETSIEVTAEDYWIKAPRCGILRLEAGILDQVKADQHLGVVADVLGNKPEHIVAPFDGVIIGMTLNPFVAKGGGVLHLGRRPA